MKFRVVLILPVLLPVLILNLISISFKMIGNGFIFAHRKIDKFDSKSIRKAFKWARGE